MLFVTIFVLPGFQAWAEPELQAQIGGNQEPAQFTLHGKLVSSTEGLKGCVLLADASVLENCGHLEILPVEHWDGTAIAFVPGSKAQEYSEHLFIFVMDGEGKIGPAVGPLEIVDEVPSVDPLNASLESSTSVVAEGDMVKVLQPIQVSDAPGQPGQPGIPGIPVLTN
jgi:hypothetical protein